MKGEMVDQLKGKQKRINKIRENQNLGYPQSLEELNLGQINEMQC